MTWYKISTYLLIALGLVHILFTPFTYHSFTLGAFWFIGTGLAIVFCGFLNLAIIKSTQKEKVAILLCSLANVIMTVLFALALFLLVQPQVFIGLLLSALVTIGALKSRPIGS